jgi:hypothetical protein
MKIKIYCLYNPQTLEIRYIGRTKVTLAKRLTHHICTSKKLRKEKISLCGTHKTNWINSLLKEGIRPGIRLLTTVEGWEDSHIFEKSLIQKHLLRHKLVNADDRGPGSNAKKIDIEVEKERKRKLKEYFNKEENKTNFYNKIYVYNYDGSLFKEFVSTCFASKELCIDYSALINHKNRFDKQNKKVLPLKNYFFSSVLYSIHPLGNSALEQSNRKSIEITNLQTQEKNFYTNSKSFQKEFNFSSWDFAELIKGKHTKKLQNFLSLYDMKIDNTAVLNRNI